MTVAGTGVPGPAEAGERETLKTLAARGALRVVVAFGDSVTSGFEAGEGWPEILGRRLKECPGGVTVINAGRPGDTSGNGLERLDAEVLSRKPDLVLVAFGLNDMRQEVPLRVFRNHVETLVERIRAAGSRAALLTTTRLIMGSASMLKMNPEPYNREIRDIAASRQVVLIDLFAETAGMNHKKYYLDLVHPNREGHELLGEIVSRSFCE